MKDGTVSMHHRNIQALAIEMYKIKNDLSTKILSNIFTQKTQNHYSLPNASDFKFHLYELFIAEQNWFYRGIKLVALCVILLIFVIKYF